MRSVMMFALLAAAPAWAADGAALKKAADLPLKAQEARDAGIDAAEVKAAIDALKSGKVPAADAADLFAAMVPVVKENGAPEGFGKMVKAKVDEGLRGEDLVKAVAEGKAAAAASPKPAPAKPTPKPKPAPMTRPGMTRPGSLRPAPGGGMTRPGRGGGTKPTPKPRGGGGGMTRPGGAR